MKTQIISIAIVIGAIFLCIVLASGLFTVNETQQAVVTQFGNVVTEITEPGLHWKTPFIQKVHFLEKRIMEWDGEATQVPTLGKKFITVDTWARWRIVNPRMFYIAVNNESKGQGVLDDQIESAARDEISSLPLEETVRSSSNRTFEYVTEETEESRKQPQVLKVGRDNLVKRIKESAAKGLTENYGIELIDVQIKHLNYVERVRQDVYNRMSSERERIAAKFLSEAHSQENEILGKMQRELDTIESEGYKEARIIIGDGDAKAAQIYADAYGQAPAFYRFLRTLETYEKTLDGRTTLVLSAESDYFKLLQGKLDDFIKAASSKQ